MSEKPVDKMTDEELVNEWLERSGWNFVPGGKFIAPYWTNGNESEDCFIMPDPLRFPAKADELLEWLFEQGVKVTMVKGVCIFERLEPPMDLCIYGTSRPRAILEAAVTVKRTEAMKA